MDPQKELICRTKLDQFTDIDDKSLSPNAVEKLKRKQGKLKAKTNLHVQCIILDFSALSYIDPSGTSMLSLICNYFNKLNIPVYVAGCSAPLYEMLLKCGLIEVKKSMFRVFPTTHDAVQYAVTTLYLNDTSIVSLE